MHGAYLHRLGVPQSDDALMVEAQHLQAQVDDVNQWACLGFSPHTSQGLDSE
jgi:hypothetical protein